MKSEPVNLTIPLIFSRAIFESVGFFAGAFIGVTAGFVIGYIYVVLPWGLP
jgi:hypothetical protein